ncbi:MAG: TIGR02147 family protein [Bacteriovoracaceae bacterium]|jgi:uncharacterized protein (TIGR02147 family)|nr:TIGR02147 family protein [Bacteriovoracaceae bacterium]
MEKLNVFNYSDYREFLLGHYESEKNRWSSFSYNVWAKKLDLKNNTSIIKVIKGQRNAGPEMIKKLNSYFSFNAKEQEYFEGLVRLSQIKDDDKLKVMLMMDLQKLNHKNKQILIDEKEFSTISNVWSFAYRQLARAGHLTDDFEKLQKVFIQKLPIRKLRKLMNNLLELNLLEKNDNGYTCLSNSINTSDDVASEALKRFHEEALDIAKNAIRDVNPKDREISGLTFSFCEKDIDEAKEMIRDFQDKFVAHFGGKTDATHIYQLQNQFFPLTKKLKRGEHETLH